MPPFVLIVEDDEDLSNIFASTLESSGFEVGIAKNGRIALEQLAQTTPDLVILDMHLPQISGAQVLEHIRSDERLANVRVIVTTADARMGESLEDQADLVLIKPVSFQQLRDLVQRFK
jgi:CheY-like chemotaxis protein